MADPSSECGKKADASDASGVDASRVATAEKAATYCVESPAPDAEALEITARPIAVDPASAYLVQVFLDVGGAAKQAKPKLVGSFSFLPPKVGRSQTFVLPSSSLPEASGSDLKLSVKIVSANASKPLEKTAVEIMSARLVK